MTWLRRQPDREAHKALRKSHSDLRRAEVIKEEADKIIRAFYVVDERNGLARAIEEQFRGRR